MLFSNRTHTLLSPGPLAVVASLALGVSAAPAMAAPAPRYAAVNGSGTACTKAAPCNVHEAVEKAPAADTDVYIEAGDYTLTTPLEDDGSKPLHVHGIGGRPRLTFTGGYYGIASYNEGTSFENLYVSAPRSPIQLINGGSMDRVVAVTGGDNTAACFVRNATVTNSTCWAGGADSVAISEPENGIPPNESTLRNVTAIASAANGVAVKLESDGGRHSTMFLTNVIARGGPGAADLETVTDGSPGVKATISTRNSNYETDAHIGSGAQDVVPDVSDQSGTPVFIDAANGDFHQACGSPTIGTGRNDPANGPTDLDGDGRILSTVTDIGSDEFVESPRVVAAAPAAVKLTGATLRGAVNPNGCVTKYHFEYGKTAAYGHSTPEQTLPNGASAQAISATIAGLTKATRYHYRLVASSVSGSRSSADARFTTVDPFAGVAVVSRKAKAKKRFVKVALSCPAGTPGACAGKLTLRKGKARLGKATFSIPAGKTVKVKVKLSKKARALLKAQPKLKAKATVLAHDALGTAAKTSGKVKVRRA